MFPTNYYLLSLKGITFIFLIFIIQSIIVFLVTNVTTYILLIPSYRIDIITTCPKLMTSKILLKIGKMCKRLNEQVKRNAVRFPEDFVFQLKPEDVKSLRSQFATSNGRGGRRYAPYVFTEHGAIMAANVLNSSRAIEMSVFVVRAFIKMRDTYIQNKKLTAI